MNQKQDFGLVSKRPQTIDMPDSSVVESLDDIAKDEGISRRKYLHIHLKSHVTKVDFVKRYFKTLKKITLEEEIRLQHQSLQKLRLKTLQLLTRRNKLQTELTQGTIGSKPLLKDKKPQSHTSVLLEEVKVTSLLLKKQKTRNI